MNELNELRDQAYENSLIYKEKMKKIYDSKIKNRIFNVGDQIGVGVLDTGVGFPNTGVRFTNTGVEFPNTGVGFPNTGVGFPNTGVGEEVAPAPNENPVQPRVLDAPNTIGDVVAEGVGVADALKLNVIPNPKDFVGSQVDPNMLVAGPLVRLPYLPSDDAVMELIPKLDDVSMVEAEDKKGKVPEVEDGIEVVLEPNRKVVEVTTGELKPKRSLPVVVVIEKGVLAKGELVKLDFKSLSFVTLVFPVSTTEIVGVVEVADPKLKTGAGTDEGITGVGVEVGKIAAGVGVVVDIIVVVVSVLAILVEETFGELKLKSELVVVLEAVKGTTNENVLGFERGVVLRVVLTLLVKVPNENIPFVGVHGRAVEARASKFPNMFAAF
ncbi:hypothetical protein Tco_0465282 [Tanacetum coccineum]